MKKDIRSFKSAKEGITKEKAEAIFNEFDENTKREAQTIEQTLRQYEGKSQSELMAELTKLAASEREKGNLNNGKLDAFTRNVSPMLSAEQQRRLSSLMVHLKK